MVKRYPWGRKATGAEVMKYQHRKDWWHENVVQPAEIFLGDIKSQMEQQKYPGEEIERRLY